MIIIKMFVCADTYMPPFTFTCRDQRTQGLSCCFGMWTLNSGCLIHHIPRFPSILYCSFSITLLTRHLHKQRDAENIPEVCQVLKLRFLCHRNKQTSHWQEKKNVRLSLAPTLINKDIFEPSKNDFKIQVWNCYSFGLNLLMKTKPGSPRVSK